MGTEEEGIVSVDTVNCYHLATKVWTFGPALPRKLGVSSSLIIGNMIYVLGYSQTAFYFYRLDLRSKTWKQFSGPPNVEGVMLTRYCTLLEKGGSIYLSKGTQLSDDVARMHYNSCRDLGLLFRFDPESDRWEQMDTSPDDQGGCDIFATTVKLPGKNAFQSRIDDLTD